MTLREHVRVLLVGAGDDPWRTDVLEMMAATVDGNLPNPVEEGTVAGFPFLIVKKGAQGPGQLWASLADSIEVWPYADDETLQTLDVLCGLVQQRLNRRVLVDDDGASYLLEYAGSALQDAWVGQWNANTRPLRFDATKLAWLVQAHPLAVALRDWTAATWPPVGAPLTNQVQTNPNTWVPSDQTPGIYWRVTEQPRARQDSDRMGWFTIFTASLAGHIVAPTYQVRQAWIDALTAELQQATVPLGASYISDVLVTSANADADQHEDGQLRIDVRYALPNRAYTEARAAVPIRHAELRDGQIVGQSPEP